MDFAVGAPYYDSSSYTDAGVAYVMFGGDSGWQNGHISTFAAASIKGISDRVYVGYSVGGGGDVSKDGLDDLLVGAPWPYGTANGAGWLMILNGKTTGWTPTVAMSDLCKITGRNFEGVGYGGMAVTRDTNGDGWGDLIAGAAYDYYQRGEAIYLNGNANFVPGNAYVTVDFPDRRYYGTTSDEMVGGYISNAGDVDGDGFDDFLLGRRGDGNGTDAKAYLYLSTDLPSGGSANSTADIRFIGSSADKCPCSVAGVGDIDADGYDDFVVGVAKNTDRTAGGKTYLFYGGPSGTLSSSTSLASADMIFYGETSGDQAGFATAGMGDLNSDGFDDFSIGAPNNDQGGTDAGKVYVLMGFPR
jgi:hypothetical protein